MPKDKKNSAKISITNDHLSDIFSKNLYLELGSIEYDPFHDLLNKKLVDFKELSYFDITNKGIGSMKCSSDELSYMLPFLNFNNLVNKNKSYQLVITYGLLLRRNGYKENFTPIILIPVKMYCEDGTILFQMVNKPIVNPYIRGEKVPKRFDFFSTEKIDNVYNIDKFILNFLNNHTANVRSESYLTVINVLEPEINLHHELFKLDGNPGAKVVDRYSVTNENDYYNITPLDKTQRNALAMASNGNSFSITGHEGTGKTTVLANIAADAIKKGKRVLYISNNDNTLQKVYDIFEANDINGFVSLLNQSFNKVNVKDFEAKKVQVVEGVLKDDLNEKYNEIDELANQFAYKKQNYLLIEILKELVLTPKPKELFDEKIMKNAYRLYKHEIKQVIKSLEIIEDEMKNMNSFVDSHFINIPISHTIKDVNEPIKLIGDIYSNFCILKEEKDILEKNYGFSKITNFALFRNRIKDYIKLNKLEIPLSWYKDYNDSNKIKDKFYNFKKANNLFNQIKEEILIYNNIDYLLNSTYDLNNIKFNVSKAINALTDKYFTIDDDRINRVLKDYIKIDAELNKTLENCEELESNFAKLKAKLGLKIDLTKTKIINEILDFIFVLDEGYFSKVWCDYDQRDDIYKKMSTSEKILDRYEECIKIYNKYFDTLSNLDINIKMLERKFRDDNSKYRGLFIKDLLKDLNFIRDNTLNISKMKKEYKELTYAEYKYNVHISDVYKEFNEKHDRISDKESRILIEKSFQQLRGSGIVDLLSLAKEFRKTILNVNVSYDNFAHYNLMKNGNDLVSKVEQIRNIKPYIKNVVKYQEEMKKILLVSKPIVLFDDYLTLADNQESLKDLYERINNNDEYKAVYEFLFKGEKTNIEKLQQAINDYDAYLDIFKDGECLINSFQPKFNGQIAIHLENAEKIIDEISSLYQVYVKMFKTNISKYYYDDFKTVISYYKELLNSQEELKTYLKITDEMKVLLDFKLFGLNNYIIYNNHSELKNRFKYTYFNYLYNEFKSKYPDFNKINDHENSMNNILFFEKDLMDNNVEIIRSGSKVYRVGKAKHLEYNQYIERNKNSKMLFLSDTNIANTFLDMDLFNLVIIDDAHMLNANEYYKVVQCKQVIICGSELLQTSIDNNLISRMRSSSILKLKYRYSKTPLNLLSQYEGLTGRFYSDVSKNKGIVVSKENYNSIILNLYKENPECKINFFTSSFSIMHEIYQNIGNVLYDKGLMMDEINIFFKNNLNVADLAVGYLLDADYNIIDLESYSDINDESVCTNMMNSLMSCTTQFIIFDNKDLLKQEKPSTFIKKINEMKNYKLPACDLQEDTIIYNVSKSLARYRIKTIGVFNPLHLVVEYEDKYYGIMFFENPSNTEFTLLNKYREFKTNDFPIVIVWLSSLAEDYNKTISEIVKGIRS